MKKIALALPLFAALLSPAMVQAKPYETTRQDVRSERRDVVQAKQNLKEEKREYREARHDYHDDRRDERRGGHQHAVRYKYGVGAFKAPFAYRGFHNGSAIQARYYGAGYTIAKPWKYGLPTPRANQRYVRHYDDVLLINLRSGKVVKVYRNYLRY